MRKKLRRALKIIAVAALFVLVCSSVGLGALGFRVRWARAYKISSFQADIFEVCGIDCRSAYAAGLIGGKGILFGHESRGWKDLEIRSEYFTGIAAPDPYHVWICGSGGTIYYWDGRTLREQYVARDESTEAETSYGFSSISAFDATHVWAAGEWSDSVSNTRAVVFFYDGKKWALQYAGEEGTSFIDVAAAGKDRAWAITSGGKIFASKGGKWWWQWDADTPLWRVCAAGPDHAWVLGGGGVLGSMYDEEPGVIFEGGLGGWRKVVSEKNRVFVSISAADEKDVWVAAFDPLDYSIRQGAEPRTQLKAADVTTPARLYRYNGLVWDEVAGPPVHRGVLSVSVRDGKVWLADRDEIYVRDRLLW